MPMTIDGTPVSRSAPKRIAPARRPRRSYKNSDASTPMGIAMTMASPTIPAVPEIAVETPPPGIPSGTGAWKKKSTDSPGMPRSAV